MPDKATTEALLNKRIWPLFLARQKGKVRACTGFGATGQRAAVGAINQGYTIEANDYELLNEWLNDYVLGGADGFAYWNGELPEATTLQVEAVQPVAAPAKPQPKPKPPLRVDLVRDVDGRIAHAHVDEHKPADQGDVLRLKKHYTIECAEPEALQAWIDEGVREAVAYLDDLKRERARASSGAVEGPPAADAAEPAPKPRLEPGTDELTLLRVDGGRRATKMIMPDRVLEYDAGTWFRVETIRVDGLKRLAHVAQHLEAKAKWFVIRARLIAGKDPSFVRRTKCGSNPNFEPGPRHHVALDFDDVELGPTDDPLDVLDVAFAAIYHLPDEFQKAACHATLTSGAGLKPGGRVRLWYWLDRPLAGHELKRWLDGTPYLDTATLEDVQPIFTGAPIVAPGAVDPLGGKPRSATIEMDELLDDLEPAVLVPDPLPAPRERPTGEAEPRHGTPGVNVTIPAMITPHDAGQYVASLLWRLRDQPRGRGRSMFTAAAMKIYAVCMIFDLDSEPPITALKNVMRDRGWSTDETTRGNTFTDLNRQLEWARSMAGEVEVRE